MKKKKSTITSSDQQTCFLVSPIGSVGTPHYSKFKEVYEFIVKPALEVSEFNFKIIRADDIQKPGSFIKDILQNLLSSFIVIVDMTGQNPNVFYELGVRHALSPRTILIAQSVDDIPSDLREYRTIIYEDSAKGVKEFALKMKGFVREIMAEPNQLDNPVLDRLGSVKETRLIDLQKENATLKKELTEALKGHKPKIGKMEESVDKRVERIWGLTSSERQRSYEGGGQVTFDEGGKEKNIQLATDEGNFHLYFSMASDGTISNYKYVSVNSSKTNIHGELADIRVLLSKCVDKNFIEIDFIIVAGEDLTEQKKKIRVSFQKMLKFIKSDHRKLFKLFIWDQKGLLAEERKLGIKV